MAPGIPSQNKDDVVSLRISFGNSDTSISAPTKRLSIQILKMLFGVDYEDDILSSLFLRSFHVFLFYIEISLCKYHKTNYQAVRMVKDTAIF